MSATMKFMDKADSLCSDAEDLMRTAEECLDFLTEYEYNHRAEMSMREQIGFEKLIRSLKHAKAGAEDVLTAARDRQEDDE